MFKRSNFCHVASNNRNNVKAGLFVYRTTDDLATVTTSGYFNEMIIDVNLHDIIIHEQVNSSDNTKVEYNILSVTEKTLDNVKTTAIKRKLDGDIEQAIDYIHNNFVKIDGSSVMTGPLKFSAGSMRGAIAGGFNGVTFFKMDTQGDITQIGSLSDSQFVPASDNTLDIGTNVRKIERIYLGKVNNGYDIDVPVTNSADTLALKSQVDDAANSGEQLYTTGVWYAKMYSASTVPTGAEYEGRNYADFSQVDGNNDPIIVVYTYTSGAWVLTQTITPPKNHNGYMTITSKIWDIAEQSGQQGGLVLWSHNQGTFTPYPRIISFQDAALTGTPTAPSLTAGSPNTQIVNKESLESALVNHGTGRNVGDVFFTMRSDSGLNGSVECNGGTYDTTDFTGVSSIGVLLEAGKIPYISLADYATALAADGSVGVFGWDGTGTTTFRVPALNDIFVETGTSAQIGDYIAPSIPNLKCSIGNSNRYQNDGCLAIIDDGGGFAQSLGNASLDSSDGGSATVPYGFSLDASRVSGVYDDDATTIQPNAVRYRAMVQLFISATDEAVATCTNITSQVAANTSAINGADYVVESQLPTALNNYTWYRKYKSGWVEQGGIVFPTTTTPTRVSVTLPITMSSNVYSVQVTSGDNTADAGIYSYYTNRTTTGFEILHNHTTASYNIGDSWQVSGVAA